MSTDEQGRSGLGIEAQRLAITRFCAQREFDVLREFVEIQTARRDHLRNRPLLTEALSLAKRSRATIVVARLDRLSRSTLVTTQLFVANVDFVAADAPDATRISLQLSALMAEYESRLISERTKEGMQAARERGVVFAPHTWNFSPETRLKAAERARQSHINRAREAYADIAPEAAILRSQGKSWAAIAKYLNQGGHVTRSGGAWGIHSVQRLIRRESEDHEERKQLVLETFRRIASVTPRTSPLPPRFDTKANNLGVLMPLRKPESRERGRAIIYCRVSTAEHSGYCSLEAQLSIASRFCKENGLDEIASYTEVERAWRTKLDDRPRLMEAISHAKAAHAKLVISRLDRLARNVSLVSGLMESKVSFVVADAPWASDFTMHMLAAIAQEESRLISSRMKEVRAAAKASGRPWKHVCNLKPGSYVKAQELSAEVRKRRTRDCYAYIEPIARELREAGISMPKIATVLNAKGLRTQRNTLWNGVSVMHLLRRIGSAPPHRSRAERARSENRWAGALISL